jgi:hypothetical protein
MVMELLKGHGTYKKSAKYHRPQLKKLCRYVLSVICSIMIRLGTMMSPSACIV